MNKYLSDFVSNYNADPILWDLHTGRIKEDEISEYCSVLELLAIVGLHEGRADLRIWIPNSGGEGTFLVNLFSLLFSLTAFQTFTLMIHYGKLQLPQRFSFFLGL